MTAHVWLAAGGMSDWIGPAIIAVFFFILPIVRAMREARERQRQSEQRARDGTPAPSAQAPVETDMDAARRKWEALLRGEEVEPMPSTPPVSRASEAQSRAFPPAMSPTGGPAPAIEATAVQERRRTLEPVLSETGPDTTFDEARLAQIEDEARSRDDKERSDNLLFAERESTAVRGDVAQWIGAGASNQPAVAAADLTNRRNVFGGGPGLASRAGLRRAILASEVFGRPVALRDGSDQAGPVGLRS